MFEESTNVAGFLLKNLWKLGFFLFVQKKQPIIENRLCMENIRKGTLGEGVNILVI